jgi:Rps23 Pro-64 3,4-dihydroxylase Tpa1-like proline 4-hydroxylase
MQELDRRVGMLRLLLADLSARRQQTEDLRTQLRQQVDRLVEFTVRRNAVVANALSAMADLDERQRRAEADLRHIELLRHRAQQELDALLVTRGVGEARARLEELEREAEAARSAEAPDASRLAEIEAEMAELRAEIERASEQAARALTEGHGL